MQRVVDNNSSHQHPKVQAWLRRHPAFHHHSVAAADSRPNWVERWLRDLTDPRMTRLQGVLTTLITHKEMSA
jgi:hypothetical protein